MIKVLFIGGRDKGFNCLKQLVNLKAKILASYILQEDDHELEKISLEMEEFCKRFKIPYKLSKTVKGQKERILQLEPDLVIVSGWRTIIPADIISLPKYGCIAFHESLLPKYRGFAPINWAVINGEKYSGVTLFYLDSGIDSGDIIDQIKIPIGTEETAYDIYNKTIEASMLLLRKCYLPIIQGKAPRRKQDHSKATYLCARTPENGKIDWSLSTANIHNLIRGLSHPFPGAYCFLKEKKILIQRSEIPKQVKWDGSIPGRIASIVQGKGVEVLTGDGSILITSIEIDKKIYNPVDYFKSIKDRLV
ncbi:methionyl-tRNA formyltransferase [Candidatus Daviesbacteria bacterium]|nr:methionyl-tRNA formyltransferase [Candidatus Daviesbacteria bacterium]